MLSNHPPSRDATPSRSQPSPCLSGADSMMMAAIPGPVPFLRFDEFKIPNIKGLLYWDIGFVQLTSEGPSHRRLRLLTVRKPNDPLILIRPHRSLPADRKEDRRAASFVAVGKAKQDMLYRRSSKEASAADIRSRSNNECGPWELLASMQEAWTMETGRGGGSEEDSTGSRSGS
ncbi:hypothetical protein DL98DRAFT_524719 [Cadophora sp. DSE1049]|nr:hypothetical protein DL98DRAFT_524719 [Cadophora sp. DSE1049]